MKKVKRIFNVLFVLALVVSMPAFSAENGCDNPENDAIVSELALCSTHVYNIGETVNPTGPDKELMKEVVAMKTTVITQQMYRQYEQMESMLRRLNTQLEKAVLNMKLQKAGASSDDDGGSSSSSWRSDNKNIHISGARDCSTEISDEEILKCYKNNFDAISNVVSSTQSVSKDVRDQFTQDFGRLSKIQIDGTNCDTKGTNVQNCLDKNSIKKSDNFNDCMVVARTCLANKNRAYEKYKMELTRK